MPGALATDLYELTMMAGYQMSGLVGPATFELYVRTLPPHRSFLIAAGLDQALEYLEALRFGAEEIDWLRTLPQFQGVSSRFFDDYLPHFRFTGEVWAVPEGTPIVPPEPLLRVTAPLPEAQIVETALLAIVLFQTSVATRAARIVEAAAGRDVIEFGARRAHGLEAGQLAARAAYIGGCAGTSDVAAGLRFDIPLSGTMAHSWVMAFPDEMEAFRRYAEIFGPGAVFLLDTYDTEASARRLVASKLRPGAVRLDSGDVVALSRRVRSILDGAGLHETKIFVSGDLDEWKIADLVRAGVPIDGFGVGGALSTSSDAPAPGGVYKLVEIERNGVPVGVMKRSPGKRSYPGRKQVWRFEHEGHAARDLIDLDVDGEPQPPEGRPLLTRVMIEGRRAAPRHNASALRARCLAEISLLTADVRRLLDPIAYPVRFGSRLQEAVDRSTVGLLPEDLVRS